MNDSLNINLILIPALPLLGAIVTAVLGPRVLRDKSHFPIIAALVGSFLCSLLLLSEVLHRQDVTPEKALAGSGFEQVVTLWTWADISDAYAMPRSPTADNPKSFADEGSRDLRVDITLRADALTSMMLSMVTFISSLVAIFASGYMHGERGYWRFFSYIGLFVFSMTMLVSVSNFVLLFVFWEAVGACSYLLIGFWYQKPEAAAAGMKAFLVNRVGDFGFACALFLIWTTYGTLNFHDSLANGETDSVAIAAALESKLSATAASPSDQPKTEAEAKPELIRGVLGRARVIANDYRTGGVALAICLLLMLGACGKSAQFPLHVWLPDAMEGPTPVSALIHAATMVTAGVYMVTRCSPLFFASPEAQLTVAIIGGFTAILAGLIALTQWDLKRVLAYSTVSQLGYMFLGLGVGTFAGVTAGMFHLFTHAFFKALLFLGSGSVMLAMGHIIDMRQFGGLRKLMPITHATFLVGCLALAGVFPLAGFWSKDSILGAVHDKVHQFEHEIEHRREAAEGHATHRGEEEHAPSAFAGWSDSRVAYYRRVYDILYWTAIFTAFLTAFYTFRAYCLTFWGEERIPEAAHHHGHHPHESPSVMTGPLIVLAFCAAFVGVAFLSLDKGLGYNGLVDFLGQAPSLAAPVVLATRDMTPTFHGDVAAISSLVALAGIVLALVMYLGHHKEAAFMEGVTDLRGSRKLLDFAWIERLRKIGWIGAAANGLESIGLGFVVTIAGYLIGFVALILMIPLLLARFATPFKLSQNKFYFDEIYYALFVLPLEIAANVLAWLDRNLIDGLVDLIGAVPRVAGGLMRSMQSGLVQFYGLVMVLAVIALLLAQVLM